MAIYAWTQPVDRVWKVVTDPENGTIRIYDEKDSLIKDEKGLKKEAVSLIEENFLNIVATKLANDDQKPVKVVENKKVSDYNPMYA